MNQPQNTQNVINKLNEIGATATKRYFTKTRINETMFREVISWLGLLTSSEECIRELKRAKIFQYLEVLTKEEGYYDHFSQIILNSFAFGFEGPSRRMLQKWAQTSSPIFTKSIFEYCRMLHRSGLHDFYDWCLPFLTTHACLKDKLVSATAFDVLEEACQDESSLNQLLS